MRPLPFVWTGEVMHPADLRAAEGLYAVGQRYYLAPQEDRSEASHRHYFACLHTAWENLPGELAVRFPTVEHLRKFALVHSGYRDERSFVCASRHEAIRMASFIKPMDEYAVVTVHETTVLVLTAKSQSLKAMGKADFQKSKDAVLDCVAQLIGVSAEELQGQAH